MAELIINNKNEFDQQVWQYETGFTDEEHGLQKKADVIDLATEAVNSPEMRYAICTICTKDDNERMDGVIIALYEYDENTEEHDDEIYFYAGSAEEFLRICQEGADEFTICAIEELSTEI